VLFVGSVTELGGAETALLNLVSKVHPNATHCEYVSLEFGNGELPQRMEELGVRVHRIPTPRLRNVRSTLRAIRELARLLRRRRIDAVVANGGHPLMVARPAALLAGVPCAWWVHGFEPDAPLGGSWISLAERWLGADLLLANSGFTARRVETGFPVCPRVALLRPGVDLSRWRPDAAAGLAARRRLGLEEDACVVGVFGRLQSGKGQHVALEAAALLAAQGVPAEFLIVGGSLFGLDPSYAEALRQRAESPDLRGRVKFLGHRTDTPALMNACDIVVMPSVLPESWGMVVIEAMAAGRAVVASAAGGPLEMIVHGEDGLLFPAGDARQLAQHIRKVAQDRVLRAQLGLRARQKAHAEFGVQHTAQQFSAAVQTLCRDADRAALNAAPDGSEVAPRGASVSIAPDKFVLESRQ
jgi:glycosyltransferase involved in cell wall biosynthesis